MPKIEIVCGIKEPKKNQRRGTMLECAEKKQIRYYGIKKVDKVILDMLNGTSKKKTYTLDEAVGKANGLKTRASRIIKEIESAKRKNNDQKIETLKKEYEKIKKEYAKIVPIANKLIKEDRDKREEKEESKKSPKKSSKKNSKKSPSKK